MKKMITVLMALLMSFPLAIADPAQPDVEGGKLIGAWYHCSGDMNGSFFSAGIDRAEDGRLVLIVEERDYYNEPLTVSRYHAPDDSLSRIAEIVNRFHMETWSDREDVIQVCDAPYPMLCLVIAMDDGQTVNFGISAYIELTPEEDEAWISVKNIVLEGRSGEPFETRLAE